MTVAQHFSLLLPERGWVIASQPVTGAGPLLLPHIPYSSSYFRAQIFDCHWVHAPLPAYERDGTCT